MTALIVVVCLAFLGFMCYVGIKFANDYSNGKDKDENDDDIYLH